MTTFNKHDLTLQHWINVFDAAKSPLERLPDYKGVKIYVKRDDLNHPVIQGNKLRKLKYNIKYALDNHIENIITFGGAWSNHIIATAAAANACKLKSYGFIRGHELAQRPEYWSKTLLDAQSYGMQLEFLTRSDYRLKSNAPMVKAQLEKLPSAHVIPEGGSNELAIKGVKQTLDELSEQMTDQIDFLISACGTGGTLAGLIDGVAKHDNIHQIIGVPVLKGGEFLSQDIAKLSAQHERVNWQLQCTYHGGGYAKIDKKTEQFARGFSKNYQIPLDKVYTAKTFFATYDLIDTGLIHSPSTVVILHTGGLQSGVI